MIVLSTLQMDHWLTVFTLVGYAGAPGGWHFKPATMGM